MVHQLVVLLFALSVIAIWSGHMASTDQPSAPAATDYQVYSSLVNQVLERDRHLEMVYIFEKTDCGAVPTLASRLSDGMDKRTAQAGLKHQRAKFDGQMKDLAPQRETLADFEQKNRTSHVLQDRFTLVGPHQMLKENFENFPRFLARSKIHVYMLSSVGFNQEHTQALVTLTDVLMRYDFLMAMDSNRHWRTVRAGGRFLMD